VNLGNAYEYTILELAQKSIELTGSASKIIFKPLPQDDPMQRQPIIKLAKDRLGWEPKINLEEGLKKTIHYFEIILSKGDTIHSN
jgi:UDP-glucuronate decarboxylase